MILTLVGVSDGTLSDAAQRTRRVGADIVIRAPNSSVLSFGNGFPAGYRSFVQKQPHVRSAAGILVQPLNGFGNSVNGVDLATFNPVSGGFRVLKGRMFRNDDELVVDDYYDGGRLDLGHTADIRYTTCHCEAVDTLNSGYSSRLVAQSVRACSL